MGFRQISPQKCPQTRDMLNMSVIKNTMLNIFWVLGRFHQKKNETREMLNMSVIEKMKVQPGKC